MKCMIVDNDKRDLEICKQAVLQVRGFETRLFETSSDAIKYLKTGNSADLIILDITLKDIDAKQFITMLHGIDDDKKPDVMICSSNNDSTTILDYIGLGVVGYVVKPYDRQILQRQLRIIRSRLNPDDIPANEMWQFKATQTELEESSIA